MKNDRIMIFLNLTHYCNMSCGYCYYDNEMQIKPGQMSLDLLKEILIKVNESPFENFEFVFHGGEPTTIDVNFFEKFFEYQQKYLKDKNVGNSLQTNGTLINDDMIELISKYHISVGISLDGPQEVHDYYRKLKNGKGTYETIIRNINKLSEVNIDVGLLSVCSNVTLEYIDKIYHFFKSFDNIYLWDLLPPDKLHQGYILSEGNFSNVIIKLFDLWFDDDKCNFKFRYLSTIVTAMLMHYNGVSLSINKGCINNNKMIFIDIYGNIYPCDSNTTIQLGNIHDHPFEYFIVNNPVRRKYSFMEKRRLESCLFCEWHKFCNGGCPFNKSDKESVNYYCDDYKKIFRYIKDELLRRKIIGKDVINVENINNISNPYIRKELANGYRVKQ